MRRKRLLRTAAIQLWAFGLFAAEIRTDFEGGSAGRIERISEVHYRIGSEGESDQNKRNRQANWYYFSVEGAPRTEMIFDIVDLPGEYNFKPNRGAITGETPPVISYDRKSWQHLTTFEYDSAEPRLRLRVKPTASRFWIAHTPPYTNENLELLRREVARHPDVREEIAGKTPEGRPMLLWTITNGPAEGKKVAWIMFRQHSWESGSSWAGEGAVRELLDEKNRVLRQQFVWKIFPMCDPDGVARGGVRFNAKGYDLNRNWDAIDPNLTPEIAAQHKAVSAWIKSGRGIDLFLTVHNTETSEYLDGSPASSNGLGERFFEQLKSHTSFAPTRKFSVSPPTTTQGTRGRMTVVQGLYKDFRIPTFLIELRITKHPRLGRLPNIQDRLDFGRGLVQAIAAALR